MKYLAVGIGALVAGVYFQFPLDKVYVPPPPDGKKWHAEHLSDGGVVVFLISHRQ